MNEVNNFAFALTNSIAFKRTHFSYGWKNLFIPLQLPTITVKLFSVNYDFDIWFGSISGQAYYRQK